MSEDRLGEIKRYWEIHYGSTIANGDIDWLISEVERLRGEIAARKRHDELNVEPGIVQRDATIATLLKALEGYGHHHKGCEAWARGYGGVTKDEAPCDCGLEKALATPAQEE